MNQHIHEPPLPVVILGHVDHGKSTLVGRLLHETGSLADGKLDEARKSAEKRGLDFEWSFLLDALQLERDQGITLDTTRIWIRSAKRSYVIIDAPGHKEFLRNMVTGAAGAEAAILVVDVVEGVSEQTRRHAYLLRLLDVKQVAVVVNKMDLVGYDQARFAAVAVEIEAYLAQLGIVARAIIPISARRGEGIASAAAAMAWWRGPSLIEALDGFSRRPAAVDAPLRLPIQDVYRDGDRRILVGRIESGRLRVGDRVRFAPGGFASRVATIEAWKTSATGAAAGQSVAFTVADDLFVERGHIAHEPEQAPIVGHALVARVLWLHNEKLAPGDRLTLRLATAEYPVMVETIRHVFDVNDLSRAPAAQLTRNGVAELVLRSRATLVFDRFADRAATGRGVLMRDHRLAGACVVDVAIEGGTAELTAVAQSVGAAERAAGNRHRGGVLWLTGLSGAGKSTLAMGLQRFLFDRGYQVFMLDGDNLRQGINSDLGFSPEDRAENIRRITETARLFVEAGMLVIVAAISPYRADRDAARARLGSGFAEIHVRASLDVCARRDPKGLYAKRISGFTGVSAPYEPPTDPDLVLDTEQLSISASLACLGDLVATRYALPDTGAPAILQ
jgi:bifunctional enzyme CysN/CysC